MTALRLGTRRSALATTQSTWVADCLRALGHEVELVEVSTEGDLDRATPLAQLGGTGVFVSALRAALTEGRVDLAVHSLKDLPTAPDDATTVAAMPAREDPRDALVARDGLTLGELPAGASIGTGSPRRRAQLEALGLGLVVTGLRGNVDTRLRAVSEGRLDAVILAAAGLRRLGRIGEATELLDPIQMLPAPGQGALAVEVRAGDAVTASVVAALDHADTRTCVTAERALLAELEAGCSAPVGALAEVVEGVDGPELSLRAVVSTPDGIVRPAALARRRRGRPRRARAPPRPPPARGRRRRPHVRPPPHRPPPTPSQRSVPREPLAHIQPCPHPHPGPRRLRRRRPGRPGAAHRARR